MDEPEFHRRVIRVIESQCPNALLARGLPRTGVILLRRRRDLVLVIHLLRLGVVDLPDRQHRDPSNPQASRSLSVPIPVKPATRVFPPSG